LVYRYGTGVETTVPPPTDMPRASSVLTDTEPRQHTHDGATGHTHGQTSAAGTGQEPTASRVQKYIPPLQLHVVLAGLVVAAAVGALGLTMRIWKSPPPPARSLERAERTGPQDRDAPRVVVTTDTSQATAPVVAEAPRVFPGRFWLLAALLAIGTALAGAWSIMRDISAESLRANLDTLREPSHLRLLLHVVFGVGIVVTLFILASLTRFARRHRGLAGVFSAVLLLAVAGQLWLGILMLYDSHEGPLTGFTPRPAASAHASASVSADFP
jgi:hypothetical protein